MECIFILMGGMQGSVCSKVGVEAVWVRDMGRDMIHRGRGSNMKSMEEGISGVVGMGRVSPELIQRSGVNMVL